MKRPPHPSPLALAILALLIEEPMHPYRMQQLIRERGKDDVINVRQRTSLYQTIDRLLRDGLIAVHETARSENRPERTLYRPTDAGRETANAWIRQMLAIPAREFPEFPAAIAHLPLLEPGGVLRLLELRAAALATEAAAIDERLTQYGPLLPRVTLIEDDYRLAMRRAELAWVQSAIDDLREGRLTWSEDELREFSRSFEGSPANQERR